VETPQTAEAARDAAERADIKQRAATGAALVAARGLSTQLLALAGNIALARLLVPNELGAVAFGTTIVTVGAFFADAGMGAAMIRGRATPSRPELEALLGLQLSIAATLTLLIVVISLPFGHLGQVTALMALAIPLMTLRTPGFVLLERELAYRPIVTIEFIESAAFYAWAIATVAIGWGVWGLATAIIVRSALGSGLMMSRTPDGVVRPRLGWSRITPMLGFGARFQAVGVVNIIRDLGLNLGTVLIAGVSTLGLWNLAYRVMQLPYLLFSSLWRVSYPAMARLLAADEPARPMIERWVGLAAVATGLVLAPLAGSATAFVPAVFGSQWTDTASVIPCASAGLMIGGPISVATGGYLYAVGDAATPLRATIAHTIMWLLTAFATLPVLGVAAIGIGWGAGSVVDAIVLGRGAVRHTQARIAGLLVFPAVGAWLGAAAALGLTARIGPSIAAGIAAVVISSTVYMLVLMATCRDRAFEVRQLVIATARGRWAG